MNRPFVLSVFKPVGMTSYDVIRDIKKKFPFPFEKIGHFGTLDPFASGLLLLGFNGASRLNDLIHEYLPKTYLAIGKLGVVTDTGDRTGSIIEKDESRFFSEELPRLPKDFIDQKLKEKFIGPYLQTPPIYSATKFQGRPLHEWAREGIEIKKEPVLRHIHSLEVVKYAHPYLCLRVTVSTGTYIRVLFEDCANLFGTHGTLIGLVRESIGHLKTEKALIKKDWPKGKNTDFSTAHFLRPTEVLPFEKIDLLPQDLKKIVNGNPLNSASYSFKSEDKYKWLIWKGEELGLSVLNEGFLTSHINFSATLPLDS